MDDDSIPGLDDVVDAIGSTDDEADSAEVLPFGMGAKAEVLDSSLPFGVGSFTEGAEDMAIPSSDLDSDDDNEDEVTSEPEGYPIHIEETEEGIEMTEEPDVIYENEMPSVDYSSPSFEELASISSPQIPEPENLPLPELEQTPEVFRLTADEPLEEITTGATPIATISVEATPDVISDEVPDMWRIDAAAVDLDEIYSQEEQVIEVSFDDDLGSGDVEVTFDEFHHAAVEDSMASDDDAPELHPARALATDAQGQPEVAQMVNSAFSHMGNSAWIEAAQVLSSASSMRQNDPSILNNLGLALLQSALEMDSAGDPMSSSQYEAAIMALRQGAKIEPDNNTLLLNLGHALLVSGRAEKALGVINVVRSRDSSNIEIENALGACLIQLGREEEAMPILTPFANDRIVSANIALI
jgi:tetratricopeptide (TPR) repeat protein